MSAVIYHNPRCSKSRQTLAILEEKGHPYQIVEYLKAPPTEEELKTILTRLERAPQDIIRFGEALAENLGISYEDDRTVEEWISLMVQNPILIERPIVVVGNKAVLGRPPESVLEIL
jgi:arsenate reductase